MSQTTRCPACQTLFKVVPDQLRISEGWVRCGQCSEIFDAALHRYLEPQVASPVQGTPVAVAGVAGVGGEPAVVPVVKPELPDTPALPDHVKSGMAADKPAAQDAPTVEFATEKSVAEGVFAAEVSVAAEAASAEGEGTPAPSTDELPPVSFLRDAQQKPRWRKPWVRAALGLAALGLVAALALQVILHERDRIAAHVPAARTGLAAACQILDCKVSPLRQIESVVIDSSTFSKLRGDAFRLAFTVKNTSSIDLAMPAIELTLTDSQDQPALRRVFPPAEFGATSNALAASSEWAVSASIGVRPSAGSERITGYRILAFYP